MMIENQRLRVSIGQLHAELWDFHLLAFDIINSARSLELEYLVESRISRMPEFAMLGCDNYNGYEGCQFTHSHCEKRLKQLVKIAREIMPDDADDYVEGLKSWNEAETSFKNELRLDYQASVL